MLSRNDPSATRRREDEIETTEMKGEGFDDDEDACDFVGVEEKPKRSRTIRGWQDDLRLARVLGDFFVSSSVGVTDIFALFKMCECVV